MKFSLRGTLRLKPFDEDGDMADSGGAYAGSGIVTLLVIASSLSALVTLGLVVIGHPSSFDAMGLALCISALTAGMEWNAGLKARACNQLFVTVIVVACLGLIANG